MKIKAIIFDLDGTAIPNKPNGMPSQELIGAIKDAQGSIRLCAATGRPIANAKYILSALELKDPCVISAGTQIVNPLTNAILWEANLESEDVQKILDICTPYHYEILTGNELLGEGKAASVRKQIGGSVNVMYVMGCAITDAQVMLAGLDKIPTINAASVTSWTHEGLDIHITHKEATKEHAVSELLNMLGLTKDEVIGVGDGDNDVHLFASVGYKVAMGNGTERLKSLADEVIASVDDNGLAMTIRKYA
jgi:hydroxymethylpyrimidine pyrophosphatase-like HAD family hydrolase